MGGQESHCQKPERETDNPGSKEREAVDYYSPTTTNGIIATWNLEKATPEQVENRIASTSQKITELVSKMEETMEMTIKVGESMKKKDEESLFAIKSINFVLSKNLDRWDKVFELKTKDELEKIFSLAQQVVESYSDWLEDFVKEGPIKKWEGPDLVGFKGEVRIIDLGNVSLRPLHVNLIVASILFRIKEKQKKTGENVFFCIRIAPGQTLEKITALKSLYSCVSGSEQGLTLDEHLPIMLHTQNGFNKYFEAGQEIRKLGQ